MRVYYFGCKDEPGHYMHTPDLKVDWEFMRGNPWGNEIDDGFKGLAYKGGWTALAMPDYTVDSRPGSNSVFLAEGIFYEKEMIEIAYHYFPEIARRLSLKERSFPVKKESKCQK